MRIFFSRCLFSLIFNFFITGFIQAQQIHFIYLQTESGKPFYVKLDNKVISSTSSGYVILPKLVDSNYNLVVGFPKNEFPEENFSIKINNKNEGFLLKNFNEQGWGLFNIESYAVTMGTDKGSQPGGATNVQNDAFSKMLATVVKDSTILQKNEPALKDSSALIAASSFKNNAVLVDSLGKDSANLSLVNTDSSKISLPKKDSAVTLEVIANSGLQPLLLSPATRISRKKSKDGIHAVYIDYNMDKDDTIKIFMPYKKDIAHKNDEKNNAKPDSVNQSLSGKNVADSALVNADRQSAKVLADTVVQVPNNSSADIKKDSIIQVKDSSVNSTKPVNADVKSDISMLPQVATSSVTNTDCKAFATNEDFLKLRKKIAAENNTENMIKVTKKIFRSKCFSTEQIKNLSFLFLDNEGKYKFFEAAYPFVSDSNQYATLQSQITDTYYLNRFKAMINK